MTEFRTSSFCTGGGCVAVGRTPEGDVALRDSKEQDGPVLRFTRDEWRAFLAGARAGEFDLP
jgi:hypothetical protein